MSRAEASDRAFLREQFRSGKRVKVVVSYALLILMSVLYIAPLLWMLSTSLKTNSDAVQWPLSWFPEQISTEGYSNILDPAASQPVIRWFVNSLVAATAHAALVLIVAAPAGYALARMHFRGSRLIFATLVATLFIPPVTFLMPNYLIVDSLGWLDTLWAIVVPGAAGALGVFFLRQFFTSLPVELEEAALVDGANRFQIFMRIVLPLSKPALATLAVLSFLTNWNDFLWPVYVLFSKPNLTLQPGLAILQDAYNTNYPIVMAGGIIASVPVLILFLLAQRYVVEGVARSGLR
ncbi:MAG: carbohydrate ABC transporter permease [Actinomycetota bacterium]